MNKKEKVKRQKDFEKNLKRKLKYQDFEEEFYLESIKKKKNNKFRND
jgi:hypothetical protein